MRIVADDPWQSTPSGRFLSFRSMVSPTIIRIVYILGALWLGLQMLPPLYVGLSSLLQGTIGLGVGLLFEAAGWLAAQLLWRVACEIAMLLFGIHERLGSIDRKLSE